MRSFPERTERFCTTLGTKDPNPLAPPLLPPPHRGPKEPGSLAQPLSTTQARSVADTIEMAHN